MLAMLLCLIIIVSADILWAPSLKEGYRQDILWLLGILTFLMTGFYFQGKADRVCASRWICRWCIWSLAVGFMLFSEALLVVW